MKFCLNFIAIVMIYGTTGTGYAKGILGGYNLGLSYSTTTSYAAVSYDTPITKPLPDDCDTETSETAGQMRCTAYLAPDGTGAYNVSVYIERPFERQGLFYFKPGFALSSLSYTGGLAPKPSSTYSGSSTTTSKTATPGGAPTSAPAAAPLDKAYIEMYGVNWKSYLQFGITPRYLPDILVSAGIGVQTVAGTVKVFKTKTNTYIIQPDGFGELEVVVIRGGEGYLSGFASYSESLVTNIGPNLIKDNPSGTTTTNYKLGLRNQELGVRLLFPF